MIIRKLLICFFTIVVCSACFGASTHWIRKPVFKHGANWEKGMGILKNSFQKSSEYSLTGTILNPVFNPTGYVYSKVFLVRKNTENADYPLLQTDLYFNNSLKLSLIQNEEGTFAESGECELTASGGEFPSLHVLEYMQHPILDFELEYSEYQISSQRFMNEDCWKVVMSLLPNDTIPTEMVTEVFSSSEETYKNRPFVREFIIGKNSGMIFSRKHYNEDGKLLLNLEFDTLVYQKKIDNDLYQYYFHTPKNVLGFIDAESGFLKLVDDWKYRDSIQAVKGINRKENFNQIRQFFSESLAQQICLLVGIGVILVGAGVWIRMKRK